MNNWKKINEKYHVDLMAHYLLKYKKAFFLSGLASAALSVTTYTAPLLNMVAIDHGIAGKRIDILAIAVFMMLAVAVAAEVLAFVAQQLRAKAEFRLGKDIKNVILDYCMDEGCFETNSGEVDTLIKQDASVYVSVITHTFQDFVRDFCNLVIVCAMLISIDFRLAALVIIVQMATVRYQLSLKKKIEGRSIAGRNSFVRLMSVIHEITGNIRNIARVGAKGYMAGRYNNVLESNFHEVNRQMKFDSKNASKLSLLSAVTGYALLLFGGRFVMLGNLSMGQLVTFMQYTSSFAAPVRGLLEIPMQFSSSYASISNVSKALAGVQSGTATAEKESVNQIVVKNLTFSYKQKEVLKSVNVSLKRNTVNYIIGKSGSGKTTFINLVMGRIQTGKSDIWYDKKCIQDMSSMELTSKVAWVSQETVIFNDTIEKNIILDKCADRDRLTAVCSACEILDDINSLPQGFDTVVEEQGNNISGGQKNRICLARALYMDKPVLIIDEVTAALDIQTEKRIRENIKKYFADKLVIIITHSPNFILKEGAVYSINNKRLKKRNLYNRQS